LAYHHYSEKTLAAMFPRAHISNPLTKAWKHLRSAGANIWGNSNSDAGTHLGGASGDEEGPEAWRAAAVKRRLQLDALLTAMHLKGRKVDEPSLEEGEQEQQLEELEGEGASTPTTSTATCPFEKQPLAAFFLQRTSEATSYSQRPTSWRVSVSLNWGRGSGRAFCRRSYYCHRQRLRMNMCRASYLHPYGLGTTSRRASYWHRQRLPTTSCRTAHCHSRGTTWCRTSYSHRLRTSCREKAKSKEIEKLKIDVEKLVFEDIVDNPEVCGTFE